MTGINTGSGSARGRLGGAYQDESGWETSEETSLPETQKSEDKKQAMLKLEQQVREAKEKAAERAAGGSRLEERLGVIGALSGMIAGPLLVMNYSNIDGKEIIAAYFGTLAGATAGGYAGKYFGKFINYLRRGDGNRATIPSAAPKKPYQRDASDRIDKEDDNRTFSGTGYPG